MRARVMHGTANQTAGGLKKSDLGYNKQGRIVSLKRRSMAKKNRGLQVWRQVCKDLGYIKSGEFSKIPKEGSAGYKEIKAEYHRRVGKRSSSRKSSRK